MRPRINCRSEPACRRPHVSAAVPRRRRRLRVRWPRLVLALAIVYVIVTLCTQEIAMISLRRKLDQLNTRIAVERERAVILDAEIAYRDTDEFIELLARRELGMVRPGEIPIVAGVRR